MPRRTIWLIVTTAVVVALLGVGAVMIFTGDDVSGVLRGRRGDDPRPGGTLRIGAAELRSLDPAKARNPIEVLVADQLFDTLVTFDDSQAPVPGLAQEWEASFDQRRFTFRLRDGVTFHDGTPVTAADAKATLDRIAAPGSTSDVRFLLESVSGYEAYHVQKQGDGMAGVTVVDERTLVVELDEPFSLFPAVLGNPGFGIVPAAAAGDAAFGEAPVGSGPMRYDGAEGDLIRLVANESYTPDPPLVEGVDLVIFDSAEAAYAALADGAVDIAPVPADRVNEAADTYGDEGLGPFMGALFYGMNVAAPDLADPKMRQAILAAVNRERIVDVAYDSTVILAQGFVPEGIPEAVDDPCGERCTHDPDRARALVAEAFPEGDVPEITIDYDDDPIQRLVAGSIRSDLEAVGIPVRLRPHAFTGYGPFLVQQTPELFRLGWTAEYPSADAFLYPLFVSGQDDNLVRLEASEVDDLLREARSEPDPAKRSDLYRQAEQLVLDRYPVVPIAQFTNRWAASDEVRRFEMTPFGTFDVTAVWLTRAPMPSA